MLNRDQKKVLAQLLFNDKEILFGDIGTAISKADKQKKWIEIFIKMNSFGANFPDYKTLRDVEWSNMRRGAEKKLQAIQSNESKSPDSRTNIRPLTAVDEIVLDILGKGKGSTKVEEVSTPDLDTISYTDQNDKFDVVDDGDDDFIDDLSNAFEQPDSRSGMMTRKKRRKMEAYGGVSSAEDSELIELERKRLRLEILKLELEVEKLPLECAVLELQIQKLQQELIS